MQQHIHHHQQPQHYPPPPLGPPGPPGPPQHHHHPGPYQNPPPPHPGIGANSIPPPNQYSNSTNNSNGNANSNSGYYRQQYSPYPAPLTSYGPQQQQQQQQQPNIPPYSSPINPPHPLQYQQQPQPPQQPPPPGSYQPPPPPHHQAPPPPLPRNLPYSPILHGYPGNSDTINANTNNSQSNGGSGYLHNQHSYGSTLNPASQPIPPAPKPDQSQDQKSLTLPPISPQQRNQHPPPNNASSASNASSTKRKRKPSITRHRSSTPSNLINGNQPGPLVLQQPSSFQSPSSPSISEITSPNTTKIKRRRRVNSVNQTEDAKKKKTSTSSTTSNSKKQKETSPVNVTTTPNMMVAAKPEKGPLSDNDVILALDLVTLQTWCSLGSFADSMQLVERAINYYETALAKDPQFVPALVGLAGVYRDNDNFPKAIEYYHAALVVDKSVGTIWEALAHCYLMADNLRDSYSAYQQALNLLPDPNVPKLWYGIAILYDRCETYELAKEAFQRVLTIDPGYDKKSDIYFRLGIIHKHEKNYLQALESFKLIVDKPPAPLSSIDIWFQIGNIHEILEDFQSARMAYEHILIENPAHAKVLQQLGWLHYQQYMKNKTSFQQPPVPRHVQEPLLEQAIARLSQSLDYETTDGYTWYLLGRSLMQQDRHSQAYAAYQQAVYRDSQNPRFWCSIGILYFRINQYRDALDAYTRAIRLAPDSLPEAWYNAAILYEVSNNQTNDAISALENAIKSENNNGPNTKMYQAYLHALNSNTPVPEELRSPIEPTVPVDRPLPQTGSNASAPGGAVVAE